MPAVDARAHPQLARVGDDLAQRVQHAVFVVGGRGGRSGDEEELARAGVGVGPEERHPVALACVLRASDERAELRGDGSGAGGAEELVEPAELRERHDDVTVLALGLGTEVLVQHRGKAQPGVGVRDRSADGRDGAGVGPRAQRETAGARAGRSPRRRSLRRSPRR